jgi:hypothetical protein
MKVQKVTTRSYTTVPFRPNPYAAEAPAISYRSLAGCQFDNLRRGSETVIVTEDTIGYNYVANPKMLSAILIRRQGAND